METAAGRARVQHTRIRKLDSASAARLSPALAAVKQHVQVITPQEQMGEAESTLKSETRVPQPEPELGARNKGWLRSHSLPTRGGSAGGPGLTAADGATWAGDLQQGVHLQAARRGPKGASAHAGRVRIVRYVRRPPSRSFVPPCPLHSFYSFAPQAPLSLVLSRHPSSS